MIKKILFILVLFQMHQIIKAEDKFTWPDGQKPKSYSPELLEKAKAGDAKAQFSVGFALLGGEGVEKNEKEAVGWLEKSANQGNALAQGYLGGCYMDGKGVSVDKEKGFKWFKKAADQGDAIDQMYVGCYYLEGTGVSQSNEEGIKWYTKSAEQGYPLAQYDLGTFYANGRGVEKNELEAIKWWTKAADQKDLSAVGWLAWFYEQKAKEYYKKAADLGEEWAKKELKKFEEQPIATAPEKENPKPQNLRRRYSPNQQSATNPQ